MTGIYPIKLAIVYYEAAKHVANIVKRFNIKDFMVKKKFMISD